MATLDDLLALLPDNTTGDIDAADLRTIVTELWAAANSSVRTYAVQWTTSAAPAGGKISVVGGWGTTATSMAISETTADGEPVPFLLFDSNVPQAFLLTGPNGAVSLRGTIDGVFTDEGSYRTAPITVTEALGATPASNDLLTLATVLTVIL